MHEVHDARGINEELILEIADGASDLDDGYVRLRLLGGAREPPDDLIAYVRDGFDALAAVIEIALALDDRAVHHAARHVVIRPEVAPQEALVVAHVLVSLEPGVEHETFSVLYWVHGTRIHIEVRIYFHKIYFQSARHQELADGSSRDAFADGGHDTANDENVFVSAARAPHVSDFSMTRSSGYSSRHGESGPRTVWEDMVSGPPGPHNEEMRRKGGSGIEVPADG